jgi:quercetin dioxygenase-like cupin family protein
MKIVPTVISLFALFAAPLAAGEAAPTVRTTELQRYEIPGTNQVAVVVMAELDPGASIPAHTHFGVELGYIVEGAATLSVAGQPDVVRKTGDSFKIPPGSIHKGVNAGKSVLRLLTTFIVEKDKPLRTPAP